MTRRIVLEMEGPRKEIDRALGGFFNELQRMTTEAWMNEPIRSFGEERGLMPRGHNVTGTLTIREDIGE